MRWDFRTLDSLLALVSGGGRSPLAFGVTRSRERRRLEPLIFADPR
jgi:hypothetical protein